jgi:hypothetical protein
MELESSVDIDSNFGENSVFFQNQVTKFRPYIYIFFLAREVEFVAIGLSAGYTLDVPVKTLSPNKIEICLGTEEARHC